MCSGRWLIRPVLLFLFYVVFIPFAISVNLVVLGSARLFSLVGSSGCLVMFVFGLLAIISRDRRGPQPRRRLRYRP